MVEIWGSNTRGYNAQVRPVNHQLLEKIRYDEIAIAEPEPIYIPRMTTPQVITPPQYINGDKEVMLKDGIRFYRRLVITVSIGIGVPFLGTFIALIINTIRVEQLSKLLLQQNGVLPVAG